MKKSLVFLLLCLIGVCGLVGKVVCQAGNLADNFYAESCPIAESIVQFITWKRVSKDFTLPAKLLRLHFHDCFVRGCDASVLLNSTGNNTAEKDAIPNKSLGGFDVIEEIKSLLERLCPEKVSCADILALAARDAVSFQYKRPLWDVPTGRKDGTISIASDAFVNLPSPFSNFAALNQSFARKNLTVRDLVVLSGGHTIGIGHCNLFSNRLYNFTGKGDQDPSLNSTYVDILKTQCKGISDNTTVVPMDPGSPSSFDNGYFQILKQNKGLFLSDAALLTDQGSSKIVDELLNAKNFFAEFKTSMEKMGKIGVLTGSSGQIRQKCNVTNS